MKRYFLNIIAFTTLLFSGTHAMADQNTNPNLTLLSNFAGEVFVNKDLSNLDAYMKKDYIQHNPAVAQENEGRGIPATQAEYKFDAIDIFRIEDGKLAEHWDVMDLHTLFTQLQAK